jgi:tetratricopeptide (TPR) repeat protein
MARLPRLLAPLVFVAAFAAFIPSLDGQFVNWDDPVNFVGNEHFRGLGWAQLKWMWTATLLGHWIPLTWMSLGLNYVLGGMNPWGYHLGNMLLHAGGATVFYLVARRLLAAGFGPPHPARSPAGGDGGVRGEAAISAGAAAAALVFAVHPLRVESVAWITERRDVLSGLFFLLTVLAYLGWVETGRGRWRLGSIALYAAALLSKSAAMMLPAALLLLDCYPLRRPRAVGWRRLLWEKVPYAALAAAAAVVALIAVRVGTVPTGYGTYGVGARIAMTAYSFVFYPWAMIWPVGLMPLYELPARVDPLAPRFLAPLLVFVGVTGVLAAAARRWPAGLAAWVYSALMVLPISGAVHAGYQLAHDRYSYLSGLGFALLLGAGVTWVVQAGQEQRLGRPVVGIVLGGAALGIGLLGAGSWEQSKMWRDSETLWTTAVALDPSCAICQVSLGGALLEQKRYREAEAAYRAAIALRPDRAIAHNNLGTALSQQGRYEEAAAAFREALRLDPKLAGAAANLGALYGRLGRYEEAADYLRQALAEKPDLREARANLARALRARGAELADAGQLSGAVTRFREALEVQPDDVDTLRLLGQALIEQGKPREAVGPLTRAVTLDPRLAVPRFWLARAYLLLGERERADAELAALRALDPALADEALNPGQGRPGTRPPQRLRDQKGPKRPTPMRA